MALEDIANWTRQALSKVIEWVGSGTGNGAALTGSNTTGSEWRMSKLARAMRAAAEKVSEACEKLLAQVALGLMEHPGRRIAAAEAGLARFIQFCDETRGGQHARWQRQASKAAQAWEYLETALQQCRGTVMSRRGRSRAATVTPCTNTQG